MKRISSIVFASMLFILACQKKDNDVAPVAKTPSTAPTSKFENLARTTADDGFSVPIPKDTANMMIQSYLTSVGYPSVDNNLRSLSYDAGVLMSYLTDQTHDKIVTVKFMLAHTPQYIHSGKYGVNAGLNPDAITLVIVGLNADGQYVFSNNVNVLDRLRPCPSNCIESSPTL